MSEQENETSPDVRSNIASLIEPFKSSPFRVAPEREAEMIELRDKLGLRIRLNEAEKDWIFEGLSLFGSNHISVSLRSLERLWGCCYAYTAIVSELLKSEKNSSNILDSAEYELAFGMLDWIAQDTLNDIESEWPEYLPSPKHRDILEHVELADHFFLMTSGRIILHEIAHVVLSHSTNPNTTSEQLIAEEFEADAWADDWMLGEWRSFNDDPSVFVGRAMGIAFSHAIALFLGALRQTPSLTHPNPMDRIIQFVSEHMSPGFPSEKKIEHAPCAMLLAVIGHLLHRKGSTPDFGDISCSYSELFTRLRGEFK